MVAVLYLLPVGTIPAVAAGPAETRGLRSMSATPFPLPPTATVIPLPGGDFEGGGKVRQGWALGGCKIVTGDDAPQGKAYCRLEARKGSILRTPPGIHGQPGQPHFLSLRLKSSAEYWAAISFTSAERERSCCDLYPGIPSTGDQWKHVGYYFWMPAQAETVQFQIQPMQDGPAGQFIGVDDLQLRTASEAEMSAAYESQRAQLPPYDVTPRPGDGRNLALSVAKWQRRAGIPGKPFVVWALGSSWTLFQGDGYPLIRAIRQRFPQSPPIVYKRHAGSGTPWDYALGWVRQFAAAEQPDLIFTYTNGTPEGLDAMLGEIRRRTTADVIVPSLHFFHNSRVTPEDIENGVEPWEKIRAICRKHKAEFVENRRELAEYMKRAGLTPPDLLQDAVHQTAYGRLRIWDNITRHIAQPERFSYAPESRERLIAVAGPAGAGPEHVERSGRWTTQGGLLGTRDKDARLKVRFTGNRINLIGRKGADGGTVKVLVDGLPAERLPVFLTNFIQPKRGQHSRTLKGPGPGDVAPHAVDLGKNVIPQTWTITVTSDVGDYRLAGSVTGPDGEGNVARQFLSRSGQIGIDARLWRHGRDERKGSPVIFGNSAGDSFTFDVCHCAVGEISFRSERAAAFSERLAQELSNGPHTLEIVAAGDGDVTIEGLYVFEPPEKE
jgi:hypothetical protein